MIASDTRRLPFDVRPFHRETVESYSSRLLAANFCTDSHRADMTRSFATGRTVDAQKTAWMQVLTTRTKRSTLHLNPDTTGWLTHANGSLCHHFPDSLPNRWACTLCARGDAVEQNPHFDNIVCTAHQRWLGLWGNPNAQHPVDDNVLAAQRTFATLRRRHLIDVRLYTILSHALAADLRTEGATAEAAVFTAVVRIARDITTDAFAFQFFNPTTAFTDAHALLIGTIQSTTEQACGTTTRALWAYLHTTLLTIRECLTPGEPFTASSVAWPHEYPLRAHVATAVTSIRCDLEPIENYLAVTGDTPATAAQLLAELTAPPSERMPVEPQTFTCEREHTFDYLPPESGTGTVGTAAYTPHCGLCTPRRVQPGKNDLRSKRPKIAAQFDIHRNGGLTAADVALSSSTNYWWLCEKGHSHQVSPSKKTLPNYRCPVCSNRVVRPGVNCLLTTHPEIAAMWAEGWAEGRSPSSLASGSNTLATWRCDDGHRFYARVWELTSDKRGCNICSREVEIDFADSLAATHSAIAARLHPTMNGDLTAAHLTHGERRKVWWQCEQTSTHTYEARIDKVTRGQGCSICCSRKLIAGENDLGTIEPVLSIELHRYLNMKEAHEIFPSDHKLWWKCLLNGHEHAQTTQNRKQSRGCPKCDKSKRILDYYSVTGASE